MQIQTHREQPPDDLRRRVIGSPIQAALPHRIRVKSMPLTPPGGTVT
ncbi:hypothetical protein ABGB12_30255 [Actinocorallia sp. B10E7]